MGVYIPLRVRLTPASIPQVVAYIQTYLKDNPIPSIDTFADLIAEFLSDHPELVAVASVNGKTGAVILTGADIMLNGDSALTLETEITNLNSMISSLSRQVAEAVATVENAQDDIDDLGSQIGDLEQTLTTLENSITQINNTINTDEVLISANTTKNAQQDTRLHAIELSLDEVDEDIDDLQTLTELHTEQITALQGLIGDSTEILERLGEVEQEVSTLSTSVSGMQTTVGQLQTSVSTMNTKVTEFETQLAVSQVNLVTTGFGTSDANTIIDYNSSYMYRTGNIGYMNLVLSYTGTLPSSGYVSLNFEFTNAPFQIFGGFGNGLSGTTGHFVYISASTFGVRITNTNATVRLMMILEDT